MGARLWMVSLLVGAGCAEPPELMVSGRYACETEAECPDGWSCWERLDGERRCVDVVECSFEGDPACDDGEPCTVDRCDLDAATCVHEPDAERVCAAGGCTAEGMWLAPARCDAASTTCALVAPESCDDGDGCTVDRCDVARGCVHEPVNTVDCGLVGQWNGVELHANNANPDDASYAVWSRRMELGEGGAHTSVLVSGDVVTPPEVPTVELFEHGEVVIHSGESMTYWGAVTPTRDVMGLVAVGGRIGPALAVKAPASPPPAHGLAGRWRVFALDEHVAEGHKHPTFTTWGGLLELSANAGGACLEGDVTLTTAAPPSPPEDRGLRAGACAALDERGAFVFDHDVSAGDARWRERWEGWRAAGGDVAVAALTREGAAKPSGMVVLIRVPDGASGDVLRGAYGIYGVRHYAPNWRAVMCWGQHRYEEGEISGGATCSQVGEHCYFRDDDAVDLGELAVSGDGAITGRTFSGAVVTWWSGQAAPLDPRTHAAPLAVLQRLSGEAGSAARPGELTFAVWQPEASPRHQAPPDWEGPDEAWCAELP